MPRLVEGPVSQGPPLINGNGDPWTWEGYGYGGFTQSWSPCTVTTGQLSRAT